MKTEPAREETLDVSIIIPAYNEEEGIQETLDAVQAELNGAPESTEIIVVDDGSQDATAARAQRPGVRIVTHRRNRGYGASIKSGVLAARGRVIVTYDADNQFDAADILRLVRALADADVAFGRRTSKSYTPFSRKGGKKLLGFFANYLARQTIPDLNCGLRAIPRRTLLAYLHLLPNGFSASTTSTLVLLKEGYDVVFVPVTVTKRMGTSTVRPLKDGVETAFLALRLTVLLDPFRIFAPAAVIFFLAGIGWSIRYFLMGRGLSVTALFLLLSAVMIFFFGLLADQVSSLRRERRYSEEVR